MVQIKARKPLLRNQGKPDFLDMGNKKTINPRSPGRIMRNQPSKGATSKREIHEALISYKVREVRHSRTKTSLARFLTRKSCYIEVSPYTPRQVSPTRNVSQFIPKTSPITPRIRTVNTCKGPSEIIHKILERGCKGELLHTLIDLLDHSCVPHYKDTPFAPLESKVHQSI